jgi:transposase
MKAWNEITYYAGFDWGHHRHKVVIVDRQGQIVADFTIEQSGPGWQRWREQVAALGGAVAACVETSQGIVIEQLLESGVSLYPIAPLSAKAYRERKAPSGTKSDHLDAWSLADALRVDGHGWRALGQEEPLVAELRLLCRDEVALIEERTALVNQLQSALQEYYPAALEAFEDWTLPAAWAFLEAFPTPAVLRAAGKRKWEKFLHSHKLARPQTFAKPLEIFARASELVAGEVLTRTKSRLALTRIRMLRVLQQQIEAYRAEIEKLFAQHPDHQLFGSPPERVLKLPLAYWAKSAPIAHALISTPCRVWPAPPPLAIKAARSTWSLCGATVIRPCEPPSICGLTSVGNPPPGQQSIIKPCAPAANPMLAPCAAWASAG